MTGQDPANPTDSAGESGHLGCPQGKEYGGEAVAREEEINALLDGELDEAAAEALKAAAAKDSTLARAIVDAWQLQKSMDQLALEKAPASLRRKLRRIPHEHRAASRRPLLGLPHWVLAGALASVVMITVAMFLREPAVTGAQTVSRGAGDAARVEQTRRELAITFHYLDKVGWRVGREIHEELKDELSAPIKDNLSKHLPFSGQSHKEKHV